MRRCSKCKITDDVIKFHKSRDTRSGKVYTQNLCVPCRQEKQREYKANWYSKNREKSIAYSTIWNKKNRAKIRKMRRLYNQQRRKEYLFRGYDG